jgi:hypothetical protein
VSKSARWTIYIAIMIALVGFGYYHTYTQEPEVEPLGERTAPSTNGAEAEPPADTGRDGR